jgi:hypothetical protein
MNITIEISISTELTKEQIDRIVDSTLVQVDVETNGETPMFNLFINEELQ